MTVHVRRRLIELLDQPSRPDWDRPSSDAASWPTPIPHHDLDRREGVPLDRC